jgi:DNA-binding MarR family transcriptional regulator
LAQVREVGGDLSNWLEYCAEGLLQSLERAWLRMQTIGATTDKKLMIKPRQEQLLFLLRDHGEMAPREIWAALGLSKQGVMDLLNPLVESGIVEKVGPKKTGRYRLIQYS